MTAIFHLLFSLCYSFCYSFSSSSLILLCLLLSASYLFIFSKIKQFFKARTMKKQAEKLDERKDLLSENDVDRTPSLCSDFLVSDDDDVSLLQDCFEGSIPDEDSLIEIELTDGRYSTPEGPNVLLRQMREGFVFQQNGIMELFSEINEEDNLIEIDINMGSIKCPSFDFKTL